MPNPRFDLKGMRRRSRVRIGRKQALYGALGLAGAVVLVAGSAAFRSMMNDEDRLTTAAFAPAVETAAASASAASPQADIEDVLETASLDARPEPANEDIQTDEEVTPLAGSDPRWSATAPPVVQQAAFPVEALRGDEETAPAPVLPFGEQIAQREIAEEAGVPVAESDAQVAELEAAQQEENDAIIAAIREENHSAFNSPVLGPARVTQYVNLRAGPSDGAEVLLVVPQNAEIQAAADCNWCEAVYDGQSGFIYRTFIRR